VIGTQIGNYRIVTRLGGGAMGEVFLAEHMIMGRRCAIKMIRDELSADAECAQRFINEARLVSRVGHPNIVEITDFGQHDSRYYIMMELLEGETLEQRLERLTMLDEAAATHIAIQVADALRSAHELGVVHRDLKPENIFLAHKPGAGEVVKVLDFGVAKLTHGPLNASSATSPGAILGTPQYMSPEQSRGDEHLDHRSDIYSLGVVLYRMLTGMVPFRGDTILQILNAQVEQAPVPPRALRPSISLHVEAAVLQALAKSPGDRFEDMLAMRIALENRNAAGPTAPAPPSTAMIATRAADAATKALAAGEVPAAPGANAPGARAARAGAVATPAAPDAPVSAAHAGTLVAPQPDAARAGSPARADVAGAAAAKGGAAARADVAAPKGGAAARADVAAARGGAAARADVAAADGGAAAKGRAAARADSPAAKAGAPAQAAAKGGAQAAQPATRADVPHAGNGRGAAPQIPAARADAAAPAAKGAAQPHRAASPDAPANTNAAVSGEAGPLVTNQAQRQRTGNQLATILIDRLHKNTLRLPSMPQAARECIALLDAPQSSASRVAAAIGRDPVLAPQVLRRARSAHLARGNPVKTIDQAVARLGGRELRSLMLQLSARQLFESKNAEIRKLTKQLWEHSVAEAVLARALAKRRRELDPEVAYIAGLLHDVGKPISASLLLEAERNADAPPQNWLGSEAWLDVINECQREVGVAVARAWDLQEDVLLAIARSDRYTSDNPNSYASVVCFANALAKQVGMAAGPVEGTINDALVREGMQLFKLDDQMVESLIVELRAPDEGAATQLG
jgi:serine/threonine-protein kinase